MINFKFDPSNNITFPEKKRNVVILINGERYRMEIIKDVDFEETATGKCFKKAQIRYQLYKNDREDYIAYVTLNLNSELAKFPHYWAFTHNYTEIPCDYFELDKIEITDETLKNKGIGTALLNYVLNDVIDYNNNNGTKYKVLFDRWNKNKENEPFYKRFGARENINRTLTEFEKTTPMIIDEPKTVGEVPIELAYKKAGMQNQFAPAVKKLKR